MSAAVSFSEKYKYKKILFRIFPLKCIFQGGDGRVVVMPAWGGRRRKTESTWKHADYFHLLPKSGGSHTCCSQVHSNPHFSDFCQDYHWGAEWAKHKTNTNGRYYKIKFACGTNGLGVVQKLQEPIQWVEGSV